MIPSTGPQAPPCSACLTPIHTAPYGQLSMCSPHRGKRGLWQITSEHSQEFGQICRPERDHRFQLWHHIWENKREAASTWLGALQPPKRAYRAKISAVRGTKKGEAGIPTEDLREPQNISTDGRFLPSGRQWIPEQVTATSENRENQGNMAPPKDFSIFLVTETQDMRSCDLPNKGFKIAILRKLSGL